jgi:Ala-tRNA(Pro) deacylase
LGEVAHLRRAGKPYLIENSCISSGTERASYRPIEVTKMQRWLDYLNEKGVHYSWSMHRSAETALDTADVEHVPAHEFAKTVVYFCETGFGMAVVPANKLVELCEVGYLLGVSYIRLATETELKELFPGCETGAMPPFGDVYNMPVLADSRLEENEFIVFNIGTHRDTVRMRFADYRRLINPLIGSITVNGLEKTVLSHFVAQGVAADA